MTTATTDVLGKFKNQNQAKALLVRLMKKAIEAVEADLVTEPLDVGLICRCLATLSDALPTLSEETSDDEWSHDLCDLAYNGDAESPKLDAFLSTSLSEIFAIPDEEQSS